MVAAVTLPSKLSYPPSLSVYCIVRQTVYGISLTYFLRLPEAPVSGRRD